MTQLFILLAQSVTGAVITIVGLLLVAGIIGYVTAWFYAKSVYKPIIKGLENDKAQLTEQVQSLSRQVEVMKGEIIKLNSTIESQKTRIKELEKELDEKTQELLKIKKPVKES